MKDKLATWDNIDHLASLNSLATKLDNHLHEGHRVRNSCPPLLLTCRLLSLPFMRTRPGSPLAPWADPSPANPTCLGEELMQLGVFPTEYLWKMRVGECLYYSQTDHFLATCTLQPKGGAHQYQWGSWWVKQPPVPSPDLECNFKPPCVWTNIFVTAHFSGSQCRWEFLEWKPCLSKPCLVFFSNCLIPPECQSIGWKTPDRCHIP